MAGGRQAALRPGLLSHEPLCFRGPLRGENKASAAEWSLGFDETPVQGSAGSVALDRSSWGGLTLAGARGTAVGKDTGTKRCPGGWRGLDSWPPVPAKGCLRPQNSPLLWTGVLCREECCPEAEPAPPRPLPADAWAAGIGVVQSPRFTHTPALGAGIVSVTLTPPSPGTLRARRDPELSVSQEVAQPGLAPRLGVASEDRTRLSRAEARPSASKEVKEAGGNVLRAASRVGDRDAVMFTGNLSL